MTLGAMTRFGHVVVIVLACGTSALVSADEIDDRSQYWRSVAYLCDATPNAPEAQKVRFASSLYRVATDARKFCNDNDMTLFNGLLCASGDTIGCDGVVASQDPDTGQWFRNPQYRLQKFGDPGNGADFSYDMSLGVQLYAVQKHDKDRFWKWLQWLHGINNPPPSCPTNIDVPEFIRVPVFCKDDCRCLMRPGDASILSATVDYFQKAFGMPPLPNGRLRGYLGSTSAFNRSDWATLGVIFSNTGYSMHITGAAVLLYSKIGTNEFSKWALLLANDGVNRGAGPSSSGIQPTAGNALFDYLAYGANDLLRDDLLASCPSQSSDQKVLDNTWHWEDEVTAAQWKAPDYWDCIFAANLLRPSLAK